MHIKRIRILASVLIIAFLIFSPAPLRRALDRDPMRELFELEPPEWYGVIEIWHIAGFRTYQGSVTSFLEPCCDEFSRKHPGLHFEVTGMTPAMYEDRIARGLSADAYSFPAGYLSETMFQRLSVDPPILLDGLPSMTEEASPIVLPYLLSGYVLLVNEQAIPNDGTPMPDTATHALLQRLASENQLSFPAALGEPLGIVGNSRDYADFLAEKCAGAIVDARALGDLQRDTEQNLLFTALPLGEYTDQVMYIGTAANSDDKRAEYLDAFYAYLLSESVQQKAVSLGAIPVRKYTENIAYVSQLPKTWYDVYRDGISVPALFCS